jgi:fibronectin type 3 domain-containing protein
LSGSSSAKRTLRRECSRDEYAKAGSETRREVAVRIRWARAAGVMIVVILGALVALSQSPTSPAGVSASDGTYCDRVRVTWDRVPDATYYQIWRSADSADVGKQLGVAIGDTPNGATAPALFHDDAGVVAETTYYYRVQACSEAGCSPVSGPDAGTRRAGVAAIAIPEPHASKGRCDGILVEWNPVAGAESYGVWRATAETAYEFLDSALWCSYLDASAVEGVKYRYRVAACGPCGCTDFGDFTLAEQFDYGQRVTCLEAAPAPEGVNVCTAFCDKNIIQWQEARGASTYEVWRCLDCDESSDGLGDSTSCTLKLIATTEFTTWVDRVPSGCSTSQSGLSTGEIIYSVRAADEHGQGQWSAGVYVPVLERICGTPEKVPNVHAHSKCTSVEIQWESVAGADYYDIYRLDYYGTPRLLTTYTVPDDLLASQSFGIELSAVDAQVVLQGEYHYEVAAGNASGYGPISDPAQCFAVGLSCHAPTVNATMRAYNDRIDVFWSPSFGADYYEVWRATEITGGYTRLGVARDTRSIPGGTEHEYIYVDMTATPGLVYYYRVLASATCLNLNGVSQETSVLSEPTPGYAGGCVSLPPPANVRASDGTCFGEVRVMWEDVSGATSYDVWRSASSDPASPDFVVVTVPSSVFDDATAEASTTYYYRVMARSATCWLGSWSTVVSGVRSSSAPPAATGIAASDGDYTDKIVIRWDAVCGATEYQVWRSTAADGTYSAIYSTATNSCEDRTAAPGSWFYYKVKACAGSTCTGFSGVDWGFRAAAPAGPTAPAGVDASDAEYPDKVHVTWNGVEGAASYGVWRCSSPSGTFFLVGTALSSNYDDTTAAPGLTYYYAVTACTASTCGARSEPDAGSRQGEALGSPTGVRASDGTYTDKVRISWGAVSGASEYHVFCNSKKASMEWAEMIANESAPSTSFDDTSATPGVTYYYSVCACDSEGHCSCSDWDTGSASSGSIPPTPTGVSASDAVYCDKIVVTWNAASGATYYEIWRKDAAWMKVGESTSTTYEDTNPGSGWDDVRYKVKACNDSGCSALSNYADGRRKHSGC